MLRLRPVVGTHVTAGTTLAWAWRLDGGAVPDQEDVAGAVHNGIHVGTERTLQQDVAFGIRQLVDIAARSLSPGINDPTTAVAALGAMSTVLAELLGRDLDALLALDDDGRVRAVVDQPTFGELLALACDQPRRYGRTEPAVLTEVLRLLTDLAEITDDPTLVEVIGLQVDATVREAEDAGLPNDVLDRVRTSARHATAALARGSRVPSVPNEIEEPAS